MQRDTNTKHAFVRFIRHARAHTTAHEKAYNIRESERAKKKDKGKGKGGNRSARKRACSIFDTVSISRVRQRVFAVMFVLYWQTSSLTLHNKLTSEDWKLHDDNPRPIFDYISLFRTRRLKRAILRETAAWLCVKYSHATVIYKSDKAKMAINDRRRRTRG